MRAPSVSVASLALLALACSKQAKPPSFDGPAVLRCSIVHFEGSYRFAVMADGSAEYASAPGPSLEKATSLAGTATPDELRAVSKVLKENEFCTLASSNRPGVPDEAHPTIDVKLDGMACTVSMWEGEYRDNPKARASLAAVESLGQSIKGRAR